MPNVYSTLQFPKKNAWDNDFLDIDYQPSKISRKYGNYHKSPKCIYTAPLNFPRAKYIKDVFFAVEKTSLWLQYENYGV